MSRTDRNWIGGDELFAFAYFENVRFHIDLYGDARGCTWSLLRTSGLRARLIFHLIGGLRAYFAAGLNIFYRGEFNGSTFGTMSWSPGLSAFSLPGLSCSRK